MFRVLYLILLLAVACQTPENVITYKATLQPLYSITPAEGKLLVLNAYDPHIMGYRNKKEEFIRSTANQLMDSISRLFLDRSPDSFVILTGYTSCQPKQDSTVAALMRQHFCSQAIAIEYFDADFYRDQVSVTKHPDGSKTRSYLYYPEVTAAYSFYTADTIYKGIRIQQRDTRPLVGNMLLGVKPDILNYPKEMLHMSVQNGQQFLNLFFKHERVLTRKVFTGKGFEAVEEALARKDYTAAFRESLRLTNSTDTKTAARAYYNCAVFMEQDNQPYEARKYLQLSLKTSGTTEAWQMKKDYP